MLKSAESGLTSFKDMNVKSFRKFNRLRSTTAAAVAAFAIGILGAGAVLAEAPVSDLFVGERPYQMYVQRWAPASGTTARPVPVIMIHGGIHTGTVWNTTPDGQPGWAPQFSQEGWNAFVVDWPGMGRSGYWPESVTQGPDQVVDSLIALLQQTGPAILIGHSVGGGLSFKLAEKRPDLVRAVVALAPSSVERPLATVPVAPLDDLATATRDAALTRGANSEHFPTESFESYYNSLVRYSPRIRNAAVGATDELKLDRSKLQVWQQIPVLFVAAEHDRIVPNEATEETARVMGVRHILLGRDWGRHGHAHSFIIERGNEEIAKLVQAWLDENVSP